MAQQTNCHKRNKNNSDSQNYKTELEIDMFLIWKQVEPLSYLLSDISYNRLRLYLSTF